MKKLLITAALIATTTTASADCGELLKIVAKKNAAYSIRVSVETDLQAAQVARCLNRLPGENKTVKVINTDKTITSWPIEIGQEADQEE